MRDLTETGEPWRALLETGERVLWHSQPGARGLFVSVLPRLLRDLVFLGFVVAALVFGWSQNRPDVMLFLILLILFLLYSLVRDVREASAAGISHYVVTDRRLIPIMPRTSIMRVRSILRRGQESRYDSAGWPTLSIAGRVTSGKVRNGRATITVPVESYGAVSRHSGMEGYRTFTFKLIAVAEPEKAVAALRSLESRPSGRARPQYAGPSIT